LRSSVLLTDKDTVCAWLDRAARQCRRVMLYLWHDLHVRECTDEYGFHPTSRIVAKTYSQTYGDAWVWLAFAPEWRLVLAFVIGKRTQAYADQLLARVRYVTDTHIPFFTSDQWPEYEQALLTAYGEMSFNRNGVGPRPKNPAWPRPGCTMLNFRRVVVSKTVVFGDARTIAALPAELRPPVIFEHQFCGA
ncbi:MAG: IS1 family transposase, partial [Candidatus Competibacteraceae bacterium]|nr:IS1 family transposase [Candidatus Competibacteraceae bacterium]